MLVLAGWAFWLSSAYLVHGHYSYFRQHDTAEANGAFYVGQREYASRDLLGFWTPSAGGGVDANANGKGLQPLFEGLFRLGPHWWIPGVLQGLGAFGSALFTLVLLCRRLRVAVLPALVAALSYSLMYDGRGAFSGGLLGFGWTFAWVPLLLLGLMWAADRRIPAAVLSAAVLGALLAVSAAFLLAAAILVLAAFWMLVVEAQRTRRHLLVLVVCATVFVISTAPVLGALVANSADSHRTLWPKVAFSLSAESEVWAMWMQESMDLLRVNAVFLIPAALGWLAGGFRRRALTALLGVNLAIILEVFLMVPIRDLIHVVCPPFASFQVDQLTRPFVPFLSVAAGALGLHQIGSLFAARHRRFVRGLGQAVVGVACIAIAVVLVQHSIAVNRGREELRQLGSTYASFFERPELRQLARQMKGEPLARVATFAEANEKFGGQHPAFAWAYGLETADGYLNLYPLRYHAFWGQVIRPALDFRDDLREYYEHFGNRIYLFNPYLPAQDVKPADQAFSLNLLSLANVRYIVSRVALEDERLVRWAGNRGTPTAAVQTSTGGADAVVKQVFVYENRAWLPRFFVATRSRSFRDIDQVLAALSAAGLDELRSTAFLEDAAGPLIVPALAAHGDRQPPTVQVIRYSADRVELRVDAEADGILVATTSYSRFWRGFVNGQPARIAPVDAAFQGLRIHQGRNDVELVYAPPYAFGAWQRVLAMIAFVGLVFVASRVSAARSSLIPKVFPRRRRILAAVGITGSVIILLSASAALAMRARRPAVPWIGGDGDWPGRQPLLVQNPKAMRTPLDIPILVQRGPDATSFWSHTSTPAAIRFTDETGHVLPYEIEEFDAAARHLAAWVLVPALGLEQKTIYMYFGNAAAADAQAPARVWDGHYTAVWHMSDPAASTTIRDSSFQGNRGLLDPSLTGRWRTPGLTGGALLLEGGDDKMTVPTASRWNLARGDWSVEFWIRAADLNKRNFVLLEYGAGKLRFYVHNLNTLVIERGPADWAFSNVHLALNSWNHVALVRSGARLKVALNGEWRDGVLGPVDFEDAAPGDTLTVGWGKYGGFAGALDELRVATGAGLPPGWSRAVYLAQTGGLFRFAPEERNPAIPD